LDGCEGNEFLSCLLKEDCMMLGWMQGRVSRVTFIGDLPSAHSA
jgi:hypothetical protein